MRLKPILGKEPAQGGLQTEHDKNIRICTSSERDDIQIVKRVDKKIPGRLTHTECMLLSGIFLHSCLEYKCVIAHGFRTEKGINS